MNDKSVLVWYKHGLGTVVLCTVFALLFSRLDFFSSFNQTWIDRDIRDSGLHGAAYFVGIACVLTACGAPRQFIAFLGGYGFGFLSGTFLATVATLFGCIVAFYTSRLLIRPIVRKRFSRQVQHINNFLRDDPTKKTIVIRLLPFGSNIVTNLLVGSSSVKARSFFTGTLIGYLPQMIVFSLLGKGLVIASEWQIALSVLLLLISSYLSVSLYKKYRNRAKRISIANCNDDSQLVASLSVRK